MEPGTGEETPRVPPPLPRRRPARSASPLPEPPQAPEEVTSIAVVSAIEPSPATGGPSTSGTPTPTLPPPLPARRHPTPAVTPAEEPQLMISPSGSATPLLQRPDSHVSHVSIVTPTEQVADGGQPRLLSPAAIVDKDSGIEHASPSALPEAVVTPILRNTRGDQQQLGSDVLHAGRSPRPIDRETTNKSGTKLGVSHLRWLEVLGLILLFLQLLGFKRLALAASLGLIHLFYVWIVPRPREAAMEPYPPPAAASENVVWINQTLRTLFPLISTDILAPFVDLLEDALMEQVPPIVTSTRISSVSLGAEPIVLTSMRTITDEEWFASLTEKKGHRRTVSGISIPDLPGDQPAGISTPDGNRRRVSTNGGHSRTVSDKSGAPLTPAGARNSRANSAASAKSNKSLGIGSPSAPTSVYVQASVEKARMRKRDKLISRIRGGHRRMRKKNDDLLHEENVLSSDDEYIEEEDDGREDDTFINYEVSFTYRRTTDMRARGTALHMLCHFGWGVRGVGGSEIPVYIDVVELRGTVRVRLLLSPSPPFAREASFSFVRMPDFDISARPLRTHGLGSFNAMDIPMLKTYIQKSIAQVAGAFVAPKHYHMDVERLLLGQDAALRTRAIGVFYIIIHGCHDLPRADTVGSCDPYVAVSYQKFSKPLYSTRTIVDTRDPSFEEPAFLLVDAETIEVGEKLVLRVCDSDRFSADDSMGVVEVDVANLIETSTDKKLQQSNGLVRRIDPLTSERPGMRAQGDLEWSVRFYPLWKVPQDELEKRVLAARDRRGEGHTTPPWWLEWLEKYMDKPDWEKEREEKRKDTLELFTGERARDEIEASMKPPADICSGILQFHIHQCSELELESLSGTYSGASVSRRKSAASGKPALNDVIDRVSSENPEPPSSYCEVHLNDKYVYRTRTKQVNPMPYFNAVSERFVRDWRLAKIVFVIRDERDREHNPILGVVSLRLKDVLKDRTQFTRWFPLVGGLGWGKLRISLLFKPIDMRLPRGVSSYEACTFDLRSFNTVDLDPLLSKAAGLRIETEHDKALLHPPYIHRPSHERNNSHNADSNSEESHQLAASHTLDTGHLELDWHLPKPVRLAVKYRHSCCLLFSVVTPRRLKRTKVHALAVLRLDDVPDGEETHRVVPVFDTSSVKEAMAANSAFLAHQSNPHSASSGIRLIGFIRLNFILHQGVSRAHRKLCRRDFKFRSVYEAWEATRLLDPTVAVEAESDSDSDDEDSSDDDEAAAAAAAMHEDDTRAMREGFGAHSKALHKKNRGIFQLKVARTGKYVKDKLESKVIAAAQGTKLQHRPHGMDLEVEKEGQSRL